MTRQERLLLEYSKFSKFKNVTSTISISQGSDIENLDIIYKEFPWLKKARVKNALIKIRGGYNNLFPTIVWINGTWINGTWLKGDWDGGIWQSGTWEGGEWWDGVWQHGTWEDGVWNSGVWENGTWKKGTWMDGTWINGTWCNGVWKNGKWWKGTWGEGEWLGGYDYENKYHNKGDSPDKW